MKVVQRNSNQNFSVALALFFTTVLILGSFGFASLKEEMLREQISSNQAQALALESQIDNWLSIRKAEMATLANTPVIRTMDWSQAGPFLKAKHQQMPWFYIFAHINPDGTYYNSKVDFAEGKNVSDRAHFKASIAGNVYASDPVVSRTLGTDIVAVTSPIYSSDDPSKEIIGVLGGMIDTSTIKTVLSNFERGPNSYAFAVNSQGIAISHPDGDRMGNINTKATPLAADSDAGLRQIVSSMLSGETSWTRTRIDRLDAYVNYTPIQEADWYIATVTDADYVERELVNLDYAALLALAILLLVTAQVWRYRRMEQRTVENQREAIEAKNQAKSVFIANMSHELRTPLNGILGYTQMLLTKAYMDRDSKRHLEVMLSSGQHLLMLINRVLDLSKIEAGRIEVDRRETDLPRLFRDLLGVLDIEQSKYNVDFSVDLGQLPNRALIDPEKIKQIVTNLVVNAFKYGSNKPVELSVRMLEGSLQQLYIRVTDQGVGMPPEQIDRAFIPFEQMSSDSDGAGLGLAIVNQLVQVMGGSIEIASTPQKGTTFRIELPLEITQASTELVLESDNQLTLPVGIKESKAPCVLIVDDNPLNLSFLTSLLESCEFSVTSVASAADALKQLSATTYDLLITDIVMPEMDGFELISAVRATFIDKPLPIIAASASAFETDRRKALELGASRFLSKPLNPFEVVEAIAELLHIEYVYHSTESPEPISSDSELQFDPSGLSDEQLTLCNAIKSAAKVGQVGKIKRILHAAPDKRFSEALMRRLEPAIRMHDTDKILHLLG